VTPCASARFFLPPPPFQPRNRSVKSKGGKEKFRISCPISRLGKAERGSAAIAAASAVRGSKCETARAFSLSGKRKSRNRAMGFFYTFSLEGISTLGDLGKKTFP